MHSTNPDHSWNLSKKVSFRFFFIFLVLTIFLNNNGAFLYVQQLMYYPTMLLHQIVPWFSQHILNYQYDYTIFTNGSGDTSYNYVQLLLLFIVSVFGCLFWSVFDRKRENYSRLYYWLIVLVRYYLAFTLMLYGSIKVIQLQFPQPGLGRLLQTFGEASPMGLAWTFLGFSKGYNLFMGIVEVSAVFLLFRKTMVIGAFLSLAASVHVMAMNYFFDVPVKILSTTLVVMCLFILAPYLLTIGRFFLFGDAQKLVPQSFPTFNKRWKFIALTSFKYLLIIWTTGILISNAIAGQHNYGALRKKPPLYGIYNVDKFVLNGKEVAPLTTDPDRWSQLIIEWDQFATVKLMNGDKLYFNTVVKPQKNEIQLKTETVMANQYVFKYQLKKDSTLVLSGLKNRDSLTITFKKYDLKKFILTNRGFHWINEHPYNR